jgi:16S rRNA (cytidine1402-2'-O)-methyltransferase
LSAQEVRGELVVVLEGATAATSVDEAAVRAALLDQFAHGASVRDAVTEVVAALGVVHRDAYEMALQLRREP